jgi:predicted nucleotidyltransferase
MSMPIQTDHPTTIPKIDLMLRRLLAKVQATLGDQFVGFYLHGSLASGDFQPGRSDIDFLVVTQSQLPDQMVGRLAQMHRDFAGGGLEWVDRLEGSYIPREALRRYDPRQAHHPALRVDGTFAIDGHGVDWILQRAALRQQAIILAGPDPAALIEPLTPQELRQAAAETLQEWWRPQLDDTHRLISREYQAYAVMTMCRIFYTFRFGSIATKSEAVHWFRQNHHLWDPLIASALAWPSGDQPDQLQETLEFIRFTLTRVRPPSDQQ